MASSAISSFIQHLFNTILQRNGETAEIAYWVGLANAGTSAAQITQNFIVSNEARNVITVLHLYDTFFNRPADSGGLAYWVAALNSGASLSNIAESFAASSEFQTKFAGTSNADYVEELYSNLFGRHSDVAGKAYWLERIDHSMLSRAAVALSFSFSDEARSSTGAATRFAESYLVLRAAGNSEPNTDTITALAAESLTAALAEKIAAYSIDSVAPLVPSVGAVQSVTGIAPTSASVTAEANSSVALFKWVDANTDGIVTADELSSLGTAMATGGTANFTGLTLADHDKLVATASDAATNTSGYSAATTVSIIDSTAPRAPTVGAVNSVTGAAPTSASVRAEANSTVALFKWVDANTDSIVTAGELSSLGTATATGGTANFTGLTLAHNDKLVATATDAATNTSRYSAATTVSVTDGIAPTTTIATVGFSADTGTSGTDFITKTAAQTISGTASANLVAGEMVEVSIDNGSTWSTATTSVGANTWSLAGVTLTASDTLKVRVTDTAGNSGTTASQAYVLDTTAPATTIATTAFSADTGTSGTDFNTKTTAQTISGTASANLVAGEIVEVSTDNGSTWSTATSSVGANTWSLAGVTLTASDTLKVHVTDAAGNSGTTASQAYVLDTTAPTTTLATMSFSVDTGTSGTDFITKTAAQTISGTASANLVAGEIMEVSTDNGSTWTTATSGVGANTWSLAGVTLTASDTLKVHVTDTAGNSGTTASQAYVLDTTAPTLSSSSPADGNATLAVGSNLTLTFNETVALGTGNIVLKASSGDSVVETFNVATGVGSGGGTVSVSGTTVTINPFANLSSSTDYNVRVDATAVVDASANAYAGIADATTLNFTTVAPAFDGTLRTTTAGDVAAANAYLAGGAVTLTIDLTDPLFRNHSNISLSSFGTDDFLNIKLQTSVFPVIAGWQKQGVTAHVIGTKSNAYSVERYRSVPNGSTSLTLTRTVRLTAPVADFPAFTPRQISLRSWQTANYHWSARYFITGLHISSVGHIAFI
ncbi:MAG: DUF4214 domain-containing protein [Pseudomonadota bacterium]